MKGSNIKILDNQDELLLVFFRSERSQCSSTLMTCHQPLDAGGMPADGKVITCHQPLDAVGVPADGKRLLDG